jgi:hypothetical protein
MNNEVSPVVPSILAPFNIHKIQLNEQGLIQIGEKKYRLRILQNQKEGFQELSLFPDQQKAIAEQVAVLLSRHFESIESHRLPSLKGLKITNAHIELPKQNASHKIDLQEPDRVIVGQIRSIINQALFAPQKEKRQESSFKAEPLEKANETLKEEAKQIDSLKPVSKPQEESIQEKKKEEEKEDISPNKTEESDLEFDLVSPEEENLPLSLSQRRERYNQNRIKIEQIIQTQRDEILTDLEALEKKLEDSLTRTEQTLQTNKTSQGKKLPLKARLNLKANKRKLNNRLQNLRSLINALHKLRFGNKRELPQDLAKTQTLFVEHLSEEKGIASAIEKKLKTLFDYQSDLEKLNLEEEELKQEEAASSPTFFSKVTNKIVNFTKGLFGYHS